MYDFCCKYSRAIVQTGDQNFTYWYYLVLLCGIYFFIIKHRYVFRCFIMYKAVVCKTDLLLLSLLLTKLINSYVNLQSVEIMHDETIYYDMIFFLIWHISFIVASPKLLSL